MFRCTAENLEVVMSTSMGDRYRTVSSWLAGMLALGTAFWLLRQQMLTSETGTPSQNGTEPPAVSAWQEAVDVSATPFPALVLRVKYSLPAKTFLSLKKCLAPIAIRTTLRFIWPSVLRRLRGVE